MNKKGVAFLTTIILLGLVVIATAALSLMLLRDAFTVKRLKSSAQAYYLAEAGIEEAIEKLWSSNFSTAGFPISRSLGAGSVSVILDSTKWSSDEILLINSTAIVSGISRSLKTDVKANILSSLDYAILSNGKIIVTQTFAQGGVVNCNTAIGIHSNSPAQGGLFTTSAVDVFGWNQDCWVYGNASAVGKVRERRRCHITGTKTNDASSVDLPPFDADFFDYYYDLANASGDVYSGNQNFTSDLNPANGVVYVNGNVILGRNITVNGCVIATGYIAVIFLSPGTFTQNQINGFPALMSRGGDILLAGIWGAAALNGLVYAADDVTMFSIGNNITLNGSIMSGGDTWIADGTTVEYVKQNPPGLGANPNGWILNWAE